MFNKTIRFILFSFLLSIFTLVSFEFALAQVTLPPPPPPPIPPPGVFSVGGRAMKSEAKKIPGATVRGRVVYEDSGLPLRYGLIKLSRFGENARYYSTSYVKTDEMGDFILKNVKPGDYLPYIKNDGILNPDAFDKLNRFDKDSIKAADVFQKISVSGTGTFQVFVRAKRGTSMGGVVRYFDGEVAVGVKVEAMRMIGEKFYAYPVGNATTDDRGYYRFAGLPEGGYTVRVIEPISHTTKSSVYFGGTDSGRGLLKTYYPQAEKAADASGFNLIAGQEQTGVDVTLPERLLYDISGKIILKSTGEPLKNIEVTFNKIDKETDEGLTYGNVSGGFGSGSGSGSGSGIGGYGNEPDVPSEWTLRSLPKGKYKVTAKQRSRYSSKDKNKPKYPDVTKEIEITDGDVENVIIEVPLGGIIQGTIISESGKALPRYLIIYAQNLDTKDLQSSEFDYRRKKEGPETQKPFVINKLTEGKIGLDYRGRDFFVSSISIGSRVVKDGVFELEAGEKIEDVRIVLSSSMGTVKGRVSNFDPNDQTTILAIKKGTEITVIFSDNYVGRVKKDGTYEIRAKPGEYNLVLLRQSKSPKTREEFEEFMKNAVENAPSVSIRKNETAKLDLSLPN